LPAGRHTVRLFVERPAAAIRWLRFAAVAPPANRHK